MIDRKKAAVVPSRPFWHRRTAQRLLLRIIAQCRRPTRSEVMKGMLDGTDIAQHMDGDGNSTAAGQDNVEKRRPLAKDGCPVMPVGHGKQSLGRDCGLDTAAR